MIKIRIKRIGSLFVAFIIAVTFMFGATAAKTSKAGVSLNEAKNIALKHAGVKASDAEFTKSETDYENKEKEYELEFETYDCEYEYNVTAATGNIRKYKGEVINDEKKSSRSITLAKAKSIALSHAGLKAADVTFTKVKGYRKEFELEFKTSSAEYDYDISSYTGKILSYEKETKTSSSKKDSAQYAYISLGKAKIIALNHAGFKARDVRFTKTRSDRDDNKKIYEIHFDKGNVEYEYEIDAKTGEILTFEKD